MTDLAPLTRCRRGADRALHASAASASPPRNPAPAASSPASLTEISGSSAVLDRGFVTYSNAAKTDLLGVSPDLLGAGGPGAVSEPVARAMAEGA